MPEATGGDNQVLSDLTQIGHIIRGSGAGTAGSFNELSFLEPRNHADGITQ